MADEEKEKAEKLAAAKKRFEQLKKEQQKKGKKGGAKKKDEKAAESRTEDAASVEEAVEATPVPVEDEMPADEQEPGKADAADDVVPSSPTRTKRLPSLSLQSKQRSESFRQSGPMSPQLEVQDLYRKQAARIEELERENKAFKEQQDESAARLGKAEEELESLREGSSDLAELRSKAKEAERLQTELTSKQRQLTQAQHAVKGSTRRVSGTSPGATEQLASKTSTIESLELEISNVRNQFNSIQTTISERDTSIKDLEERAKAAETATETVQQELDALKISIAFPSEETKAANEDPEALTKRITVLESDLRTANTSLDAAAKRVTSLEQKIEALTRLHRDATTTSQSKDRELADLRTQLKRRDRPSHVRDASEFELRDEETETGTLQTRIRALEAENFDLRRGVWRDKRAELQPGMHDDSSGPSPEGGMYEDVDLNGPYSPHGRAAQQQHSTFQDVITSGISAFTSRSRETPSARGYGHDRKQSLGLLSEDDGKEFDAEAFRLAQEEEAKRRIERMKEVKRGLEGWRGWRVDLVELREGGREWGPVFEV